MANPRLSLPRLARLPLLLAYATTVAVFLWICAQFYLPGKGFTFLIMFGDRQHAQYIPALRAVNHYELEDSPGYDAQYYAQIAMHPQLSDPVLKRGVDNLAYRARRILFCWTAYGLALGDPVRAMHIYSVQNIVCWLLLAVLMLRWFPATCWGNFFRWFSVLFSFGLCINVRGSLVDGPSLLMIAGGVALAEAGRPWWSALVLGISGLGRETNILGGAALARPAANTWRSWLQVLARGLIVVLPLALWLLALRRWLGPSDDVGLRNFTLPLVAYFAKWSDVLAQWLAEGWGSLAVLSLVTLVAITAQFLFFVFHRRWQEPWWRVAAAYSILMIFLGDAVWEGYPGAASRVLLPMTLAFNILVPRGRAWWVVLLLGNLTIFISPDTLRAPGRESFRVEGDRALRLVATTGQSVEAIFDDHWYPAERSRLQYWRWCSGSATVILRNPQPFPILATVSFELRVIDDRTVGLWEGGRARWERKMRRGEMRAIKVRRMRLEPGETLWTFKTDMPATYTDSDDRRRITFSLRDLKISILGKADDLPPGK